MLKPGYPVFAARARRWIGEQLQVGRALRHHPPADAAGAALCLARLWLRRSLCAGPAWRQPATPAGLRGGVPLGAAVHAAARDRPLPPRGRPMAAPLLCGCGLRHRRRALCARLLGSIPCQALRGDERTRRRRAAAAAASQGTAPASGCCTWPAPCAPRACATPSARWRLLPDLPDVTLTQAGDGEELELCKAEAERLGVADRVNFLGRIPRQQVEELYASSDAFLFPSFREPSGSVVFEAMRHGLPVIASRSRRSRPCRQLALRHQGAGRKAGAVGRGAGAAIRQLATSPENASRPRRRCPRAGAPAWQPGPARSTGSSNSITRSFSSRTQTRRSALMTNKDKKTRILAVSSGGGHWIQMLRLRPAFAGTDVTFASVGHEPRGRRGARPLLRHSRCQPRTEGQASWLLIRLLLAGGALPAGCRHLHRRSAGLFRGAHRHA